MYYCFLYFEVLNKPNIIILIIIIQSICVQEVIHGCDMHIGEKGRLV